MTTPSQQAVIDAWAAQKTWVEQTLPPLALALKLPPQVQDIGETSGCNSMSGDWDSDGDCSMTCSNLVVGTFAGITIQAASFSDATTVQLPLNFSKVEIDGRYSWSQPCALYNMGHASGHDTSTGTGSISQTVVNNTLSYVASFVNGKLTLTGVVVNGAPSVSANADGGMPGWLMAIFGPFAGTAELTKNLQNVFMTADFSNSMIDLLNQQLAKEMT